MSRSLHLPDYQSFSEAVAMLSLPISGSELHGVMCGYLCADANDKGEAYIQALILNQQDAAHKSAVLSLFDAYAVSQQQIQNLDFQFKLMLPPEQETLIERARAFSEWCDGFTKALALAGIDEEQGQSQETLDAIHHLTEFASLDYESLEVEEEDEHSLMEISEYARMAVLSIHTDFKQCLKKQNMKPVIH